MKDAPRRLSLEDWGARYRDLCESGLEEPWYGGPLRRHVDDGDTRLLRLRFDDSPAALGLWNFLLTEEERLHRAREEGHTLVGAMKDLGTVPVMAFSLPRVTAFYPDGAWWIPCVMEHNAGLLRIADSLGIDEAFCPVRAMLGAFVTDAHFPVPDLLTCSVGATCDDFSAIAQRLEGLGHAIHWWEMPHRRSPEDGEPIVELPGGFRAPRVQVEFVRSELERVHSAIEEAAGQRLDDVALADGIREANRVRVLLAELRRLVYTAPVCPMPALEMQIAEMLAVHFCSDRAETIRVYEDVLAEARDRIRMGVGVTAPDAVRVYWVNPVADLRALNILEESGGRLCGSEILFSHAMDPIPAGVPPLEALARTALADPMVGNSGERAERVCRDIAEFGAEAVIISRIPGASHCATEGTVIGNSVRARLGIPVQEIEVPPVCDSLEATLRTRIEALIEVVRERKKRSSQETSKGMVAVDPSIR